MGTPVDGDYNHFPQEDYVYCSTCGNRIAFVQDHVSAAQDGMMALFEQVYSVFILANVRVVNGFIIADTYCSSCRMFLGWMLIADRHLTTDFRAGRFWMDTTRLVYYEMLNEQNDNQVGEANEPNDDQDGVVNEQYHDQDGGADAQNDGQDGVVYEQDHDQDGGASEQHDDQDGDAAVHQLADGIDNIDLTPNSRDIN